MFDPTAANMLSIPVSWPLTDREVTIPENVAVILRALCEITSLPDAEAKMKVGYAQQVLGAALDALEEMPHAHPIPEGEAAG